MEGAVGKANAITWDVVPPCFGAACIIFLLGATPLAAGWSDDPECQSRKGEAVSGEELVEYFNRCYEAEYFTVRCFQDGRKIFEQGGLRNDEGVFRSITGKEAAIPKSSDTTCTVEEED
jgi:hypothetical protein